jgi:hypothetical protein
VGQTFWLGVFGAVVGVLAALAIKEIPLRHSNEAPVPTRAIDDAAATAPAGAAAASSTPTSASSAPSSPSSPSGATPATKPARQTD